MKNNSTFILAAAMTMFALSPFATAENLTGYDIAKRADEVPEGETSSKTATMTLISKKGAVRVREIFMKSKDYGDVKKSVIVFELPKDVSGTSYLVFDYDEKTDGTKPDSDNWLYLPALKKEQRITGSNKGDSFMGSDFTYDDIGDRGLSKDTYKLLGEENVNGNDCYIVEALAKDKTEKNPRRVLWIIKENYMLQKAEYYDRQNMLQRELECSGIEKIGGYWTVKTMSMKNVQSGTSTLLEMKGIEYDVPMDDNQFTVAAIRRGIKK